MRKLQILLGLALAVVAVVAVLFLGRLNKPVTFEVVVAREEIPAYTELSGDAVTVDTQSLNPAVAETYVLADEFQAMLASGVVAVEVLHRGQPLLRAQVASGADAEGLSRLAVALTEPDRVIFPVPVDQDELPALVPGDVVALFFSAGQVQAHSLVTYTVEGEETEPPRVNPSTGSTSTHTYVDLSQDDGGPITITTELLMPLTKWTSNGVVYRLNRQKRENPNYGAPGMESEPRYIEGDVKSLDVVVRRDDAEWVAFALAHGRIQVAVLPAVAKADVEAGTFPPGAGVTWTDFESRFFEERAE